MSRSRPQRLLARLFSTVTTRPTDRYASTAGICVCGVLFLIGGALLASTLVNLWPVVDRTGDVANKPRDVGLFFGLYTAHITKSTGLLILAMLMGAIGGYVHATTSFVSYLGNRQFKASWGWWYGLRAFIGAALGLITYFALRAGFLNSGTTASVDPYGVAAIAALTGLFSKQATDKLEEIFNTAFRTGSDVGDETRRDKISRSTPVIQALEPTEVQRGAPSFVVVKGKNFDQNSKVEVDSHEQETTFVNPRRLRFALPADQIAEAGVRNVVVRNPDGSESPPMLLTVR